MSGVQAHLWDYDEDRDEDRDQHVCRRCDLRAIYPGQPTGTSSVFTDDLFPACPPPQGWKVGDL